jgi:hypothetical protein
MTAIFVMAVQQWSVVFIKQQAREEHNKQRECTGGQTIFDHERHSRKNER